MLSARSALDGEDMLSARSALDGEDMLSARSALDGEEEPSSRLLKFQPGKAAYYMLHMQTLSWSASCQCSRRMAHDQTISCYPVRRVIADHRRCRSGDLSVAADHADRAVCSGRAGRRDRAHRG